VTHDEALAQRCDRQLRLAAGKWCDAKNFISGIRLALSMLARDWRAGEWRVLLIALVLAVGSISTVGCFRPRTPGAATGSAQPARCRFAHQFYSPHS